MPDMVAGTRATPQANGLPAERAPVTSGERQSVLLPDISWTNYLAIGQLLRDRPGLRLTYDRGRLEIMTTSFEHEILKKLFSKLVETLFDDLEIPTVSAGNMTFQQVALERGFEPDDCYWIAHEPIMRGRTTYDPLRDPPPDLTIEIDLTRSSLNRMAIFAAFRVPEVWRYDASGIHVHCLQADGSYAESSASQILPGIAIVELEQFLRPNEALTSLDRLRAFRAWVQTQRSQG